MDTLKEITVYIDSQPEEKRNDIQALHQLMLKLLPDGRLWFDNGRNSEGKIVTNPTIGYGFQQLKHAGGKTKEFFQVGISGNTSGISVYIMGLADRTYLPRTFGTALGKAKVTGYCISFKRLNDIDPDVLEAAMRYGIETTAERRFG